MFRVLCFGSLDHTAFRPLVYQLVMQAFHLTCVYVCDMVSM